MALPREISSRSRTVADLRRHGVAAVPTFGYYNYPHAMTALPEHRHRGAVEICYVVRGCQTYQVGGRKYHMRGGDVFMTLPDEAHSTGGAPEEKGILYWLTVLDPARTRGSLAGLPQRDSRQMWQALTRMKRRAFPGKPEMKTLLDAMMTIAHESRTPMGRIVLANHMVKFLLEVIAAGQSDAKEEGRWRFQDVFQHIDTHLDDPDVLDVKTLAGVARLSPSRFKARFKEVTGIPPAEYALRARVEEARQRLAKPGASVTNVAFAMGFSSSQHFAAVFKRLTNSTPRETRKRVLLPCRSGP